MRFGGRVQPATEPVGLIRVDEQGRGGTAAVQLPPAAGWHPHGERPPVTDSASWRLTKPLRWLKSLVRRGEQPSRNGNSPGPMPSRQR